MLSNIFSLNISAQSKLLLATAIVLAALIAIICHELSHGFAALSQGDPTAKMSGRLTLNPLAHFDLFGFLMMLTVGIGWARPVPVNPNNFRKIKKGCFIVSIAGVLCNLIIAIISFVLYALFYKVIYTGLANGSVIALFFYYFLQYCVIINVGLIAFNLLPIYPLDGFRIIESFTRYNNRFCIFMRRYGMQIFLGLFLLGFVADFTGLWWVDVLGNAVGFLQNTILNLIESLLSVIGVL